MKIRFKVRTERVIVLVVGLVLAIAIIRYVESIQKSSIIYVKVNAKQLPAITDKSKIGAD